MKTKESGLRPVVFMNRVFERQRKLGEDACKILAKVVESVDSYQCVSKYIQFDGQTLILGNKAIQIKDFDRVFLIGFGKAAVPMAKALLDKLGKTISNASVITKDERFQKENENNANLAIYIGGHPVPTESSVRGTRAILNDFPQLTEKDLVLVVISGGGSALFTDPIEDVSLNDLQLMTQALLKCGADINEINILRKHLDQVKGGRLAARLMPAHVESLILSDVVGDRLDMIASGPTVEDPTTFGDALKVISKYNLEEKIPIKILEVLRKGRDGKIQETLKPGQLPPGRVDHHLVGSNYLAADAAKTLAKSLGYNAIIITTHLTGRSDHLANLLSNILQTQFVHNHPVEKPACLIIGGEPTVHVIGGGLGGRNMDLTLRMVPKLSGMQNVLFLSFATDGDDGPTNAAGAVTDGFVMIEGIELFDLDVQSYIKDNNSYHYFEKVGGLIKTGETGTNVNDIILLMINE